MLLATSRGCLRLTYSSPFNDIASKHRVSKCAAGDIIPGDLAKAIDDVTIMESKAHAMEKALKKYVHSRKEELGKAERLLAAVDDEAGVIGVSADDGSISNGRVAEYSTKHINTERDFVSKSGTYFYKLTCLTVRTRNL